MAERPTEIIGVVESLQADVEYIWQTLEFNRETIKFLDRGHAEMRETPMRILEPGFAGDYAGLRDNFGTHGQRVSDEQAQLFIEELRNRYGELTGSDVAFWDSIQTFQPQPGDTEMRFLGELIFERQRVDIEFTFDFRDADRHDHPVIASIRIIDPNRGDIVFPPPELSQLGRDDVDLNYVISVYGEENELVGQRLIGSVVRTLHEIPVLPPDVIAAAGERPHLAGSDLAESVQEGDPLDEVPLGPEAQHLQVHALAGALQGEVRHQRGLEFWEGQDAHSRRQLPAAGVFRAFPGADERLAHGIRLVLAPGSDVVALEAARLRVELQGSVPAFPFDGRREVPRGGEEQARQELGQPEPVLAGGAEDGERAVEAEPVSARDRLERVDQTEKLHVMEDEPDVGPFT
jgi:hypothetical protein